MTLREKLADWITGGELTRAWDREGRLNEFLRDDAKMIMAANDRYVAEAVAQRRATAALRAIAAMETPGANATVRRMAKIAKEALK